ncbi:Gfo/Idh/MocA family protein [Dyadobacter sp. BHUBP1]|uniref:Gfo/Idh/MocA family protein n=1 Tax=Dyadobacter sp. BHUBP1 TaxID=3424178 RepID=UPI003D345872
MAVVKNIDTMERGKERLGVALVGLGEYATGQLMPALKETKNCFLAGLVSGDPRKLDQYNNEFGLTDDCLYSYENFDSIAENGRIDIVYIVLPNSLHAEYSIRAMKAGKHVICEKPMAMNVAECEQIIETVRETGMRFSMGYRLHFDPFNQEMMRLGRSEKYGQVRNLTLLDSMEIGEKDQWRLDPARSGGGPLVNNGIYCIQAAIYITGKLPAAVDARFTPKTDPEKFRGVEEGITWTMYFGDNVVADCESSYSKNQNLMRAEAESGWFELDPAYEYEGLKGRTSEGEMQCRPVNQQALQMDDFALCVVTGKESRVPAEMGLRDMKIIAAVYESAEKRAKVDLYLADFAIPGEGG